MITFKKRYAYVPMCVLLFLFIIPEISFALTLPSFLTGYVRDTDNNSMPGAIIDCGAGGTAISMANGSYVISLPAGTYTCAASSSNYISDSQSVTITGGSTVTQNFTLLRNFGIDSIYPTLGQTNIPAGLDVHIFGQGFDANTKVSMYPDTGNKGKLIGEYDTPSQPWGMDIVGTTAYIADVSDFLILDVTDPTTPKQIGLLKFPYESPPNTRYAREIEVAGNYAYLAADYKFLVIDISAPEAPVEKFALNLRCSRIKVADGKAYIPSEDTLYVYDIQTNPINPTEVGSWTAPDTISSLDVVGTTVYAAIKNVGLQVINFSTPSEPVPGGLESSVLNPQDVAVNQEIAYIVDSSSGLHVIDVSEALPIHRGTVDTRDGRSKLSVVDKTVYVSNPGGLEVFDVSDPVNPYYLTSFFTSTDGYSVRVVDSMAYLGTMNFGLKIYDVSNLSPLPIKGSLEGYSFENIAINNSTAYLTTYPDGLKVIDVSDTTSPTIVPSDPYKVQHVALNNNKAYLASGDDGLQVLDITEPSNISLLTPVGKTLQNARDVYVSGNNAFVTDPYKGLRIIDIDSQSEKYLDIVGEISDFFLPVQTVKVDGTTAYVIERDPDFGAEAYLHAIDVSTPATPGTPTQIPLLETYDMPRDLVVTGGVAYVAYMNEMGLYGGLQIIDVSTPSSPGTPYDIQLSLYPYFQPQALTLENNRAYLTIMDDMYGESYIVIIDIDPAHMGTTYGNVIDDIGPFYAPLPDITVSDEQAYATTGEYGFIVVNINTASPDFGTVSSADTPGYAQAVTLVSNKAIVADMEGGLQVIDIDSASEDYCTIIGFADTLDSAQSIFIAGNIAYVADRYGGLRLFDVTEPASLSPTDSLSGTPYAEKVFLDGSNAYVAGGGVLHLHDITDPAGPILLGIVQLPGIEGIAVKDNRAYITIPHTGIKVVDVDPLSLTYLDVIDEKPLTWPDYPGDIIIRDNFAYMTNGYNGLLVVNVDQANTEDYLSTISSVDTGEASSLTLSGNLVYIADWRYGLKVIDVSDPYNPVLIGDMGTPGYAYDVVVDDAQAYIAQPNSRGLVIFPLTETVGVDSYSSTEMTATLPSPDSEGNYTVQVYNSSQLDELLGGVTFTDQISLLSSKAIIVAGGGEYAGNLIWQETKSYANYAYDNLIYQGYKHEDITYITDEPNALDHYGVLASFANLKEATKVNLQDAILNWAAQAGTSDLLIFLEDHGDTEQFILRGGTSPEILTADELDGWLDTLQQTIPGKVVLIYDACRSGSFIHRNRPPSGKTRLILTSSAPDQAAYFLSDSHSFSTHFWSTFSGKAGEKAIMTDAFARAATNMSSYQAAQLDANGNGIPNEPEDFTSLEGYEGTIYALRRQYNYNNRTKPVISSASNDQNIVDSAASLTAKDVFDKDGNAITRVWAEIYRPDFELDPENVTITGSELPYLQFTGPDANNEYSALFSNFNVNGTYIITYYAEDSSGIYSLPKTSLVTRSGGTSVDIPDQYEDDNTMNAAPPIIVDSPIPQNHSFHIAGDMDWVKFFGVADKVYNIRAMNPTLISDPVVALYNSSGQLVSPPSNQSNPSNTAVSGEEESIIGWTCPANGAYYIKVTNNSIHFGANVRYKLWVYNPDAFTLPTLPGTVSGTIISGGSPVAGAFVSAPGAQPQYTNGGGGFTLFLPEGPYTISVALDGYQTITIGGSVGSGQNINIAPQDMNSVPQIINTPPTTIKVYEQYSYIPVVVDSDGDPCTFSINGTPDWASFNSSNGALTGKPSATDIGFHGPVTITATDNAGASDSKIFTIEVEEGAGGGLSGVMSLLLRKKP